MLALCRYYASYSMLAAFGRIVNTAFTVLGGVGKNHMLIPSNLYGGRQGSYSPVAYGPSEYSYTSTVRYVLSTVLIVPVGGFESYYGLPRSTALYCTVPVDRTQQQIIRVNLKNQS